MAIRFERQALYEEVWAEPLTRLGKRYGMSDNGLRKVCKALNIPLPRAGHWAKVAAGHTVKKPPLPAKADQTAFISHPPPPDLSSPDEATEDAVWLKNRTAFEEALENRIVIDPVTRHWHPVLRPFREKILERAKAYERHLKEFAKKTKPARGSHWNGPNFEHISWYEYARHGLIGSHKASPIRIFSGTHERALLILNVLFYAAEKRGFQVSYDDSYGRFLFSGFEERLHIRLSERTEDKRFSTNEELKQSTIFNYHNRLPTGELKLSLDERGLGGPEISDDPELPLEEKLNAFFVKCYQAIIRSRKTHRRWKAEEALRKQEQDRRAAIAAERAEQERIRQEEKRRQYRLLKEAATWRKAELIRDYVTHVTTVAAPNDELERWKIWALAYADNLDPTATRAAISNQAKPNVPDEGGND